MAARGGRPRGWQALALGLAGIGLGAALAAILALEARRRRWRPLSLDEWLSAQDGDFDAALRRVTAAGVAPEARAQTWPVLLGLWQPGASDAAAAARTAALREQLARLLQRCRELEAEQERAAAASQESAPQASEEGARFAAAQRIVLLDAVRTPLPPAEPGVLSADQPGHAGQPPPGSQPEPSEGKAAAALQQAAYLSPAERRQAQRLISILCAYALHDPDTGYCQGMSDLAVPFLAVLPDDGTAFGCFAAFMRDAREHFREDGAGIRRRLAQLAEVLAGADPALSGRLRALGCGECFFAYRMALVLLRRELPLPQAMTLWEVLWAERLLAARQRSPATQPGAAPDLLAFVLAAAVLGQRRAILGRCASADDVLALFASQRLRLPPLLRGARRLQRAWPP